MSVDPTAMERSALEKKDRQELATIVTALGGKAGSRAKKAELVDLVLELTGVSSTPAPAAEDAGTDPAAADASTTEGSPPAAAGVADREQDRSRPAADAGADAGGQQAKPSRQEEQDRSGQQARSAPQGQGGQPGQPGQQGQGGQPGQGGPSGDGGPHDGDGEGGSRRRRRRGRNRERAGQESGGQPQAEDFTGEPVEVAGILDLRDEGYGFLRVNGYLPSRDDVYVSVKQVRQFGLRKGDTLAGASRPALRNEKNPALLRIDTVNGVAPDAARARRRFEDLTPLFPDQKLKLELADDPSNVTARIIDLIAPIGKGQRGLIVSPPKAGKTTIMKQIVRSIETNDPDVVLFVLLVDERPEEVTDMRRWLIRDTSTVVASTFDRPAEEHALVAELVIERAKRLVEDGKDVVVVLDGITRLARAYNLAAPATGRVMSGGIDTGALYPPKKFFGAARNIEEGGSLTILATALVETGSRMDEVIFEEFKGTGNMELRLDRRLAEHRVYPAIDVSASSTRHEELLFPRNQLDQVWKLRRVLSGVGGGEGGNPGARLELLIDRMKAFPTNDKFLHEIAKAPLGG
jgi:transcription termination factor Rho